MACLALDGFLGQKRGKTVFGGFRKKGETVTVSIQGQRAETVDLRSSPPAEEFSRSGSNAAGEGLGAGRGMTQMASGQILGCPRGQEFAEFSLAELTYDLGGPHEPADIESVDAD